MKTEAEKTEELRLTCRVPERLKRRVLRVQRALGVSESDVVRMALNLGLQTYEQKKAA